MTEILMYAGEKKSPDKLPGTDFIKALVDIRIQRALERTGTHLPDSRKETNTNITGMEWYNVLREQEIISVGDLHGSIRAFEGNLLGAGLINKNGKWIGGDKRLVFHGDILADRNTDSFSIISRINTLKEQAIFSGGALTVLAGNHEDFVFDFLIYDAGYDYHVQSGHGIGLTEFQQFGTTGPEILSCMREHSLGFEILDSLCQMKLIEQHDDSIFVHVVPHQGMLEFISRVSVDDINTIYSQSMRAHLLGEGKPSPFFNVLRSAFLHTNHRSVTGDVTMYETLKRNGINNIIHGHDAKGGLHKHRGGIDILSTDFGFEWSPGRCIESPSIATIQKDGVIRYGDGNIVPRNQ